MSTTKYPDRRMSAHRLRKFSRPRRFFLDGSVWIWCFRRRGRLTQATRSAVCVPVNPSLNARSLAIGTSLVSLLLTILLAVRFGLIPLFSQRFNVQPVSRAKTRASSSPLVPCRPFGWPGRRHHRSPAEDSRPNRFLLSRHHRYLCSSRDPRPLPHLPLLLPWWSRQHPRPLDR